MWARLLLLFALALVVCGIAATTAMADVGSQDESWSGTGTPTGTKRAASLLWFNDGSWWANKWDVVSQDFHIFRLDSSSQSWADTGVTVDRRYYTHADTLWDGTHLYVASHKYPNDQSSAVAGYPSYLYRFSYDALNRRYLLDSGFPVAINNEKIETLVIAKDSTGKLWATWQQDNQIYVNRTTGDDRTWGTPFALPAGGSAVTVDDNSALIAFGGNQVGIMWSNQTTAGDGLYFSVHQDGQPDTAWSASRTAIQGSHSADDHLNLHSDANGRVYATIKTSYTTASAALTMLLVRDATTGDWAGYPIASVSDCPTRPLSLIDEQHQVVHTFATYPAPPAYTCDAYGGAIYEKTSALSAISFPAGRGTPVMVDDDSRYLNNVSSTKQNVNSQTGIATIAADDHTLLYWHALEALGSPVAPTADFTASPTSGAPPLVVQFSDASSGLPTGWSWDFGDGSSSTARNPSHTYSAPGSYSVSLTATNAAGSTTSTRPGYITVSPALTFTAAADADVGDSRPTTNYGTATTLRVRQGSATLTTHHSYLKFSVTGLASSVQSAKLRLYVTDASAQGGKVYAVSNDWTETGITWNNAPALTGSPLAVAGTTTLGGWLELDITPAITGNGTYSLGIASTSTNLAAYSSHEGTNPPQLVVTPGP